MGLEFALVMGMALIAMIAAGLAGVMIGMHLGYRKGFPEGVDHGIIVNRRFQEFVAQVAGPDPV